MTIDRHMQMIRTLREGLQEIAEYCVIRLQAAEALLHQADEMIEMLNGDRGSENAENLLAEIEQHWLTYPDPMLDWNAE